MPRLQQTNFYQSRISGTGSFLPAKLLTNSDLEKMVETTDAWILERTGIRTRHIAEEGVFTSDLALKASQNALKAANLDVSAIDMILLATVSPDQPMPNTACVLQSKLGARNVMALDISAACSGFVYGLGIANQFIRTGQAKHILVVGAEVLHRYVNYKDRETCILFGDGAGAVILSRNETEDDAKIFSQVLQADGQLGDLFVLPAGGSKHPLSQSVLDLELQFVRMRGREIFKNAVRTMVHSCQLALDEVGMKAGQVDWLIPHQANIRILEAVIKYFDFPLEKAVINLQETGNTSAATIPVALDEAVRDGRIRRGQNLLMTAFGAGLTSGSILLRY